MIDIFLQLTHVSRINNRIISTRLGARNLQENFRKFRVSEYTNRNLSRNLKLIPKPETVLARIMLIWPALFLILAKLTKIMTLSEVGSEKSFKDGRKGHIYTVYI